MPLRLAEDPTHVRETVRATLAERIDRSDVATPALRGARADDLFLAAPHPVYTLGLQAVGGGQGPDAAELTGWRYLVQRDEKTIAAAELHLAGGDAGTARALELNEGPFVRATEAALEDATRLPQLADAAYEFRLLKIPAVYVIALWLHAVDGGGGDVFVPIGDSPPEVDSGRAYGSEELLSSLGEQARRQLEFDSTPGRRRQTR
jgi:hypothetical protein